MTEMEQRASEWWNDLRSDEKNAYWTAYRDSRGLSKGVRLRAGAWTKAIVKFYVKAKLEEVMFEKKE
jgi:hypothetical protein